MVMVMATSECEVRECAVGLGSGDPYVVLDQESPARSGRGFLHALVIVPLCMFLKLVAFP
ncbi:hypothetical protein P153DRAFT_227572 [Dothidotthia symphoricarpi CBS 119687]|uniref:Uncharacterized protein n=1 Tax=Dothidotthia symphoricarpi CBS 119687 TaxID=1392245 RepID=A0A6A6AHN7_9PLEO|nr:uncharacterized protein P153DRAFT_227572 [Dothidotthia symphoricarpi CBS 119687]KAF2129941.1 hypothetical protein P153DRAFT_227572 [Dothidotthia symphoricarpi CBS 119687]